MNFSNADLIIKHLSFIHCIFLHFISAIAFYSAATKWTDHLACLDMFWSDFTIYFFSVVVDPTKLSDGLHYYEVYGVDCKAPWRGPLFRVPITITKPVVLKNQPPVISFNGMSFLPGSTSFFLCLPLPPPFFFPVFSFF